MKVDFRQATRGRPFDRRAFFGWALKAGFVLGAVPVSASLLACAEGDAQQTGSDAGGGAGRPDTSEAEAPARPAEEAAPSNETELVTELPAATSLVVALNYRNESPEAGKNCGNCQLYSAGVDGNGKCQLFPQGLVREAGWCASWIEKMS